MIEQPTYIQSGARIKVIGCGGAGCNAINRMVQDNIQGVEFAAVNTDYQHLAINLAPTKILLGERSTRGLGAGGRHEVGQQAAEESAREIERLVEGSDMVFVAAGMGGGTGTGSAPVVAEMARRAGALTIAIVTRPFDFEGTTRAQNAEEGLANLIPCVDTLVIVPNQKLFDIASQQREISVNEAFKIADMVLSNGVRAISEVITKPGLINLDFADVRSIMTDAGPAWMSMGCAGGPNRVIDAAKLAVNSPLLTTSIEGAKGVMFNVTGSSALTLQEVNTAAEFIREQVDADANVIFGVSLDESMGDNVRMTLIATGFATPEEYLENSEECGEATYYSQNYSQNRGALRDMRTDTELDIPSFLRTQSSYSSKRATAPQSTYNPQNANPYSSYGSTYTNNKPAFGQRSYATRRAW